ncbi:hypothetical protein [Mycolicibacterium fortuitum]|uniref:hypothetical protein n=1 Tax=Mycolicibacterium fortuitum TaxID=1766 RepID=UPI0007EA452F|nr:hypothetical protein [Mycolicibacterium fortuitum]MCA4755266.1 hypothetical protein [Mycolicibacterium fortuitum]MDG5769419.1 hypothetical protein [Mycolicibacterium fortuitum]MDG5780532.1 hypothetical protein [Mycolicibacterium fortuitum]OBB42961.1 hypothetical protein A5754_13475 [Mycolicibacterium fortuitum]OBB52164.1 hypothetical protein A5755_33015 [Mycolicibacterium fortuitum]
MGGVVGKGDIVVNTTNDGVPIDQIWQEYQDANQLYNTHKTTIADLLSYRTILPAEYIAQSLTAESMDEATEFGVPRGMAPPPKYAKLGFTFHDFDKATRISWRFLRGATAEQVRSVATRVFEADTNKLQELVFGRLFSNAPTSNDFQHTVYSLWNGDGMIPPSFMGKTFDGTHTHYLVSGGATIDSQDVELAINHVTEHGYGITPGSQLVLLVNPAESEHVQSWRAGQENANTQEARWDFVPSSNAPAWISAENIHGAIPPPDFHGLKVLGSYGKAWVIESYVIPQGYFSVVATGGLNSADNPLALREHEKPEWRGLKLVPGPWQKYPLVESFFMRGIGIGTRHRGAAVVVQCKASGSYEVPTIVL